MGPPSDDTLACRTSPAPVDSRSAYTKIVSRSILAFNMLAEKMLRWCLDPHVRSAILRMLGASIGDGTRVNEVTFINIQEGFKNFCVGRNSHVGPGSVFDLVRKIQIGDRTVISAHCTFLTHDNPGYHLGSALVSAFPNDRREVTIGSDCLIGAGVIIVCGVSVGNRVVIRPGSVVTRDIPDNRIAEGNPVVVRAGKV